MSQVLKPEDVERYVDDVLEVLRLGLEQYAKRAAFGRVTVPDPEDFVDTILETFEALVSAAPAPKKRSK